MGAIWTCLSVSQTKRAARQEKQLQQRGSSKSGYEQWEAGMEANFSLQRGERNSDHCDGTITAEYQLTLAKMNIH